MWSSWLSVLSSNVLSSVSTAFMMMQPLCIPYLLLHCVCWLYQVPAGQRRCLKDFLHHRYVVSIVKFRQCSLKDWMNELLRTDGIQLILQDSQDLSLGPIPGKDLHVLTWEHLRSQKFRKEVTFQWCSGDTSHLYLSSQPRGTQQTCLTDDSVCLQYLDWLNKQYIKYIS